MKFIKYILATLLLSTTYAGFSQSIYLGPNSPQVSGILNTNNGGTGINPTSIPANYILAGPASGGSGPFSIRKITLADLPGGLVAANSPINGFVYGIGGVYGPATAINLGNLLLSLTNCTNVNYYYSPAGNQCSNPLSGLGAGIVYSNTNGSISVATANQIVAAIGGTYVQNATNAITLVGGALGSVPFQNAFSNTSFVGSPTTAGHTYFLGWQPSGSSIAPFAIDAANYLANPPNIGASNPATGAFTALTDTSIPSQSCIGTTNIGTILGTVCYNIIQSNGTPLTQRYNLNFGSEFVVSDNGGSIRTDVHLAPVGTAGTYSAVSSITTNQYGQILSVGTGGAGIDYYWTTTGCSTGVGQPVQCVTNTTLPGPMPDANYQIFCTADAGSSGVQVSDWDCNPHAYPLPTTTGGIITYNIVQTMQNGGGGGTPQVYFHAHHN